jgi:hypothetical protein
MLALRFYYAGFCRRMCCSQQVRPDIRAHHATPSHQVQTLHELLKIGLDLINWASYVPPASRNDRVLLASS